MLTIDEIRIEGEEDGFHLVIYADDDTVEGANSQAFLRFRIGLPDQFHAEVQRTIGRWLDEGEAARATMPDDDTYAATEPDYDLARDIERGK